MKYRSKLIVLLILLFNVFIINVKANDELVLNNVENGVVYLDLDDNKSKRITLDSNEYEIYSCYQSYGDILEYDYQQGECIITAKKYGKTLVTVTIANKNNSTGDLISKQVIVDVDFDNYLTQILNNIPDQINTKLNSNSYYEIMSDFIPNNIMYSGENCKAEGDYEYCDFSVSYSYPKEITEDHSYVWEYVSKSKKIRFLSYETDLPYIPSYNLDLGDKTYLSFNIPNNINPDDLMLISTNNTIVSIEDGDIVAKSPGEAEIRLYNKKTLEYSFGTIRVKEPKIKNIDELVNYFKDRVVDIDAATFRYYGPKQDMYKSLAMQYFNFMNESLSNNIHVHATNATCVENKCKVEFLYYDNNTEKRKNTEEFTINYKGISSEDYLSMSVWNEQGIYTHNFNFDLYLDSDDDFTVLVDDEYLNFKTENYCFDSNGIDVDCGSEQEDLSKRNTYYYLTAKKTGETKIQIISDKGYMKEITVYITHTQDEIESIQNYFYNLNSINLPYSNIEFQNNLYYLEQIIKTEIENTISASPLYQYLNLNVECTFYNKCNISADLEKKLDKNGYNNLHINRLSDKTININFDNLNNSSVITNLINDAKSISDFSLTLDDTLYLEKMYNDEEFYENLIYKTDILETINNSIFDISFELIETEDLNDNIKGNSTYRVCFKYNDKVIFKKDIIVYSNHFITMPPKEKNTLDAKISYLKTYVDRLLESDVLVEQADDNIFKVIYDTKEFYLILDKKEITQIQHVSIPNNIVNLNIGDTHKIIYTKYPTFANTGEVTFESEDENIVTVDENGVITALSEGYTRVYAKVNHSSSSMWVLVNKDMQTVLNEKINNIQTDVVVLYSDIYSDLKSAISSAIWSKNREVVDGFNVIVTEENGKYYAHLEVYGYSGPIASNKREINFELKGIKVKSKDIEMNTGDIYDLELYFSEGDTNNLLFDYDNKDVVSLSDDGKITALKPGYSYIYINDKFNKYHNYTKVLVDKDKFYNESINKAKSEVIEINSSYYYDETLTLDKFDKIVSQIFHNRMYDYIPFYIFNKNYDSECDVENNTCVLKIYNNNNNEILEEHTFNIQLNGVFVDGKIKEISLNDEYEPIYKKYPENGDIYIESLDTDVCLVEDNKIKGINIGVCPIKYTSNIVSTYQLIVVDRARIVESIKNNFDSVNNNLILNLDHYVSPYVEGEEWNNEWIEYDSLYNTQIYHEVENRIDLPYEIYFYSNLESLETNPYEIDLKLNAYYQYEEDNVYLSVNLIDSYTRTFNVDYSDIPEEDLELGKRVKANIKDTYHLNLLQTLRFKMDGSPGMILYEYSSIGDDILEVCPNCTYLFDNYTGGGGGDIDMMSMGGAMVILKNGIPIGAKNSNFEVRFGIEMDVIESVDDIIDAIKDKVKEAYIELKNILPFNTYSLRANMFRAPRSIPEPVVEVTRERDEETKDVYYNIKVDDIEFRANVDIKTTSDVVYTRDVTEIKVNKEVVNLKLGESESISYEVLPLNATDKNVKWTTSNSSVAVYEDGKIIAKGEGNAIITITSHNNVKKTISVNVTLPIKTNVKKGDINLDGKINMTDLIKLRKQQAGLEKLNTEASINADINNDGRVNMTDIIKLRKYFAGLEDIK